MSRTRSTRAAALAIALLLPLGLVACSDADDSAEVVSEGAAGEGSTTTDAAGDTASTTEGSGDTTTTAEDDATTTTEGDGEASSDLSAILLTVDDLPAGHAQDGEDDTTSSMGDDEPLCDGGEAAPLPDPVEEITRDFQTEDYSSIISSYAARFDGDDAEEGLGYFRSEIERCDGTDPEASYELRELSGIGDEAFEITFSDPTDPAAGSATIYFARVDDVLLGVSVLSDPSLGIDGEELLATSADRA